MRQLTSKYKLYLYLFFFIFLTTIFNFQFLKNFQDKFSLKTINIYGLSKDQKKIVEIELRNFKNTNFFKLKKDEVLEKLNKFNFLESIYVDKIIPSSLNVNLSNTPIVGKTIINGEKLYIGNNGKLINENQVYEKNDVAIVFGDFAISDYLNLLKILEKYQLDLNNIEKYFNYKNNRWDLFFSNGQILMLPSKKIEESINVYLKLRENNYLLNTKIVDLRVTNQIILTKNNE